MLESNNLSKREEESEKDEVDLDRKSFPTGEAILAEAILDVEKTNNDSEPRHENSSQPERSVVYLNKPRLYLIALAIWTVVFLVNMEISIVSTSLVTITNDFHTFSQTSWVVSAYQITYTCLLIIWAKSSDIFGRKWPYLVSIAIFVIFSGACGASQSMVQLIIFRAFQGVGASGAFSISTSMIYEMVPKAKLPIYGGLTFMFVALATVTGPLLGGAIDTRTTWRWIFLLNVPVGALVLVLVFFAMPTNFPYSTSPHCQQSLRNRIRRIDFVGVLLMLVASILLVTGLLEASSTTFKWSSPTIIVLVILAGLLWGAFFGWGWWLSTKGDGEGSVDAIFPARFWRNRVWMGVLIVSFFVGIPITVLGIELPQRSQAVNIDSPVRAGIHLLAFSVAVPIGSLVGNIVAAASSLSIIVFLFLASLLELLGVVLLSTLENSEGIPRQTFAYEVIAGFGSGMLFSIMAFMVPHCVEQRDIALGSSTFIQIRMLGSALGIAVAGSVINSYLTTHLSTILTPPQLHLLLENISELDELDAGIRDVVRHIFGQAYDLVLKIVVGLAAVQVVCVGVVWKRPFLVLKGGAGH